MPCWEPLVKGEVRRLVNWQREAGHWEGSERVEYAAVGLGQLRGEREQKMPVDLGGTSHGICCTGTWVSEWSREGKAENVLRNGVGMQAGQRDCGIYLFSEWHMRPRKLQCYARSRSPGSQVINLFVAPVCHKRAK